MLSSWWQMAMSSLCIVPLAGKYASCSVVCCSRCGGIALVIDWCARWHCLFAGDRLC